MIVFKKKFVTLAEERWSALPAGVAAASKYAGLDAVSFLQAEEPVAGAVSVTRMKTLVIDLTTPEEELFAQCHATTRKGINRGAQKDGLVYSFWHNPPDELILGFHRFYSAFAKSRGIEDFNPDNLLRYSRAGILDLSVVRSPQGRDLTWHSHVVCAGRVRQLHFASSTESQDQEFRYLTGRSNRFHHWQDLIRFKREGNVHYDFGGIYDGSTDAKKLHINEFKESFGGTAAVTYNCDVPLTLRGWMYLQARRVYRSLRGAA